MLLVICISLVSLAAQPLSSWACKLGVMSLGDPDAALDSGRPMCVKFGEGLRCVAKSPGGPNGGEERGVPASISLLLGGSVAKTFQIISAAPRVPSQSNRHKKS